MTETIRPSGGQPHRGADDGVQPAEPVSSAPAPKAETNAAASAPSAEVETAGPAEPGPATHTVRLVRRHLGVLLVGGGAFLITLGLLLHFHVYSALALLPADTEQELHLDDESATFLDTSTWQTQRETPVERHLTISGEPSPGNAGWTTWTMRTTTSGGERLIGHSDRRVIVDREAASAVNCCSEHVDGDHEVRQAGLVLNWPADAPAEDVPYYDADIRAAPQMRYSGTEEVGGVETRRYEQTIPATQVPDSARQVPARVLDSDRDGTVEATRWLELTRTVWVEPVTGHVVHMTEERHETLRSGNGAQATLVDAELRLVDAHISERVEEAQGQALLLRATREWIPGAFAGLGPLLWAAATVLVRRGI
ncbi:DUF3068 domain-containing protein [Lipingzhangella sp. LS1_29]|uniref:DUF3068 domain-containing protein n=1 Tax=Lipingzhangella rawalii TaxID=2055835 RepID=A0ABU2HBL7_9ACTN|nr:DUF3068 domain-containing protein [Lipingzhangella rawalii]MDS1272205.1 DUF3068 domain-containing protein [Lipingzhangella rawalii]